MMWSKLTYATLVLRGLLDKDRNVIFRFMFSIVSNVIVPVGFMSGLAASDYCGKKRLKKKSVDQ